MKTAKTEIQEKENRKRTIFIIKLIVFVLLLVFGPQIVKYSGDWGLTVLNVLSAVVFFLGGNIIVSLVRIITVRLYLRKKGHDPMRSNFVLGINRIAEILNAGIFIIALILFYTAV